MDSESILSSYPHVLVLPVLWADMDAFQHVNNTAYLKWFESSRIAFFAFVVAVMTMTLNGLAMGMGTLYPNFKEDNPSKIVSGFGGTFCLVLSFLYIVFSVVVLALGSPWRPMSR